MTKKLNKSSFQKRNLTLTLFLWISLFSFSQEVIWNENKVVEKKIKEMDNFYSQGKISKALEISDYLLKNEFEKCETFHKELILSTRASLLSVENPKECYNIALILMNLYKSNSDYFIKIWGSKTEVDKIISGLETATNKLVDENPSLGLAKIGSSAKSEISNSTASGVKKTDTKEVNIQKESKTIAPITDVKTQDNNGANNESEIKTKTEVQAQTDEDKTVTLTVTGTGSTSDEAKEKALRNAIEQAFGAFISSKTEILNDEIVSDQITSVSSGNIVSYKILNEAQIPTGGFASTLNAVVSVNKLTSFVQAKGVSVEINGGLFALNIKQQLLNEQAEINVIYETVGLIHEIMQNAFDYSITMGEPTSLDDESKNWKIPCKVTAKTNKNWEFCSKYLSNTLQSIGMTPQEVENYQTLKKKIYSVVLICDGVSKEIFLRKQRNFDLLELFASNFKGSTMLFNVQTDVNQFTGYNQFGKGNRFEKKIHDILPYYDWLGFAESGTINLLSVNQVAGEFDWTEERSLEQIQLISAFEVKPRGTVSKYQNGGYLVSINERDKFVVSIFDAGRFQITEVQKKSDDFNIAGYNDWKIPTANQYEQMCKHLRANGLGFLIQSEYWCTTENGDVKLFDISNESIKEGEYYSPYHSNPLVRFVRNL